MPGGAFGDCGIFEPPSQVQTGHPKNHRVVGSGSLLICHLGDLDGSFMQVNVVQVSLGRTQIPYCFWMEVLCGLQHSGNWWNYKKGSVWLLLSCLVSAILCMRSRLVLACHVVPCWLVGAHASWMEYTQKTHLDYLIMRDYQACFYSILSGFNFDQVLAILPESCIFRSSSLKTQCLQGRRMRGQP